MRDRCLLLAPGLGLCALVLVASTVHSPPKRLLLGLVILFVLACGAGLILDQDASDRDHDAPDRR